MPESKKRRSLINYLATFLLSITSLLIVFSSEVDAAFRFVSWGDAQNESGRLSQTANQAITLNPALTIFNGDLENDGSSLGGLTTMTGAMGGLFGKTFLVRGNHDTHIAGSTIVWQTFQNTALKAQSLGVGEYTELNASLTYSFDYDNTRFIAVDVPGDVSEIAQAQLDWIDSRLTDAETSHPNLVHAFIYFHGPVYCVEGVHCNCTAANDSSCTPSSIVTLINNHPIISGTFHGHEHILGWTHISSLRLSQVTHEIEQFVTSPAGGWTYNSDIFPERVDHYDTGNAQGFAAIDVNGNTFTVNLYRVGNVNPVWTRTFTKTGVPSVTIFPTPSTSLPTPTPSTLREFYVATNGNDSNPGTLSNPWRTIGKGASSISAGDTLLIRGGTYSEVVNISRSGNTSSPIIIDNYQNEIVVIDGNYSIPSGTWSPLVNINGSYVVFRDIEVTRSNGEGVQITGNYSKIINIYTHHNHEAGVIMTGDDTVADGCRVYYNSMHNEFGSQLSGGGGWGTGISAARHPSRAIIRNTVSWNNWGEGISTFGADHTTLEDNISYDNWSVNMYIQNVQYALVQRNLIYRTPNNIFSSIANKASETGLVEDNESGDSQYGISSNNVFINNFVYGAKGNFVHWSGSTGMLNALVANNTFVNATGRSNVDIQGSNTNVQFKNNIIVQDDSLSIAYIGSGVTKSNNLWSRTPPANAVGINDIIGNPLLARTGPIGPGQLSPLWFTLTNGSLAINKALNLTQVTNDFFKSHRPYGTFSDIGGHEYGGVIPTGTVTPNPTSPVSPTPSYSAAILVNTINTFQFSPPSPDPSGITYLPISGRLLVSDSEVDEMPIYANKNLFEVSLTGNFVLAGNTNTLAYSHEPTGVSYDVNDNYLFVSDDDQRRIFRVTAGTDGVFGTPDDSVISFSTSAFGSTDPESVAYANISGQKYLFIADGINTRIYQTSLSGTLINSFDVSIFGLTDIEGVTYNNSTGTIFILEGTGSNKIIVETTIQGGLVRVISLTSSNPGFNPILPADLVFAPSSSLNDDPAKMNLYIVDRGIDNDENPNENDGKIYEMSLNLPSVTLAPVTPSVTPPVTPPVTPVVSLGPGITPSVYPTYIMNAPPPQKQIGFSKLYGAIQTAGGVFGFSTELTLGTIISSLLKFIFPIAGLILLLFIVLGGFRFMTSVGDPKAMASAKSLITTAFIGFIIIFLAYWLTRLLATILGLEQIKPIF